MKSKCQIFHNYASDGRIPSKRVYHLYILDIFTASLYSVNEHDSNEGILLLLGYFHVVKKHK